MPVVIQSPELNILDPRDQTRWPLMLRARKPKTWRTRAGPSFYSAPASPTATRSSG